jgi:hypothetical protein
MPKRRRENLCTMKEGTLLKVSTFQGFKLKVSTFQGFKPKVSKFQGFNESRNPDQPHFETLKP